MTAAGAETVFIDINVCGLRGRRLIVDSPNRWPMIDAYNASIAEFPIKLEIPRSQLIAYSREFAMDQAIELFQRFHWKPSRKELAEWQAKLGH